MASKPATFNRLRGHTLTTNFRAAVAVETTEMIHPSKGEVLVKNKYVGINAVDVHVTKGRYFGNLKPPIDIGFEALGEIVEIGADVKNLKLGQFITYCNLRITSYSEYTCVDAEELFCIPEVIPEYLVIGLSGFTASIALEQIAEIRAGETVLINCAAGGFGHIAVQWAKQAGCHTIGLCSTEEKVTFLKELGCDRVINYREENLEEILQKEYEQGINVILESIGGPIFETCFRNLSKWGRLIMVGGIAGYKTEEKTALLKTNIPDFPHQIYRKNATICGFLLPMYKEYFAFYYKVLTEMMESGKLKITIDNGEKSTGYEFFGMEGIIRGVEHLHSGKNIGKVIVRLY